MSAEQPEGDGGMLLEQIVVSRGIDDDGDYFWSWTATAGLDPVIGVGLLESAKHQLITNGLANGRSQTLHSDDGED